MPLPGQPSPVLHESCGCDPKEQQSSTAWVIESPMAAMLPGGGGAAVAARGAVARDDSMSDTPAARQTSTDSAQRRSPPFTSVRGNSSRMNLRSLTGSGGRVPQHREIDELRRPFEHLRHQLAHLDQGLLSLRVLFASPRLLLALEDHEVDDPARVLVVSHGCAAQEARPRRLRGFQQLVNALELGLLPVLQ